MILELRKNRIHKYIVTNAYGPRPQRAHPSTLQCERRTVAGGLWCRRTLQPAAHRATPYNKYIRII